jgi:anti-sigma B factor antagonist
MGGVVMEIDMKERENAVVLNLKGDIDYNSYKGFSAIVADLLEKKTARIALNMAAVTHIDSMGLGTITKLWKTADQQGGALVLADVPKNIRNMIKLVNLDKRILIFDTVDEAVA